MKPIYIGERTFLGREDLVVSFYTLKCQYKCSFCCLPSNSSTIPVHFSDLIEQIDYVFEHISNGSNSYKQLSIGIEGSIFDTKRFSKECLYYLLNKTSILSLLEVISFETRPEFIQKQLLKDIITKTNGKVIDVVIGFETIDDNLRNNILKKKLSRKLFENKVSILGEIGIRLTTYVLLKSSPYMTEIEGKKEAVATIEYLINLCEYFGVELIIYLNPMYIPKESLLTIEMEKAKYTPPRIQTVLEIISHVIDRGIPIYTGLWSEGLCKANGDFTSLPDFDIQIMELIKKINKVRHPNSFMRGKINEYWFN
jgi:radical SAM enzyme (TIGR01210 family)